jgi:hypothetical protein
LHAAPYSQNPFTIAIAAQIQLNMSSLLQCRQSPAAAFWIRADSSVRSIQFVKQLRELQQH